MRHEFLRMTIRRLRDSMKRRWVALAFAVLCQMVTEQVVRAGCPAPPTSSMDPCLVVCPAGDSVFVVHVRDWTNTPVAGADVTVDFCGCPGFRLAPHLATDPYSMDSTGCHITMYSDTHGIAAF